MDLSICQTGTIKITQFTTPAKTMPGDNTDTLTGPKLYDLVFDGTANSEGYESWVDLTGKDFFKRSSFVDFCGDHYPAMAATMRAVLWSRYAQHGFAIEQPNGRWKRVVPCV